SSASTVRQTIAGALFPPWPQQTPHRRASAVRCPPARNHVLREPRSPVPEPCSGTPCPDSAIQEPERQSLRPEMLPYAENYTREPCCAWGRPEPGIPAHSPLSREYRAERYRGPRGTASKAQWLHTHWRVGRSTRFRAP